MSTRCNVFVKNIQAEEFDVRAAEVASFIEYLNALLDEGSVPLEVLGQGVCSNILFLLITKHVQPALEGRGVGSVRAKVSVADKLGDVARLLYEMIDATHSSLPHHYPLVPLLWKSAGAFRKVMEHTLTVLESDTLVTKCGVTYANVLRLLLKFEGYRNVVSKQEMNRGISRLLQILKQGTSENSWMLGTATSYALCEMLSCSVTLQHLEDIPAVMQVLCEMVRKYHESFGSGTSLQPMQSDLRLQANLVKAVRILSHGAQFDSGTAVSTKANALIKPLLSVWHRTSKRDEWRFETLSFLTIQLSFMFAQTLSASRKESSAVAESPQNLHLLHNDVVPLTMGIVFPNRREMEYDGSGKIRMFPLPLSMANYVRFGSLVIYLACVTYSQFQKFFDQGDQFDLQRPANPNSAIVDAIAEQILALRNELRAGTRPGEINDGVFAALQFLGQPLTSMHFPPTTVTNLIEQLLMCFPSANDALDVGILTALRTLWNKAPTSLLLSGFSAIIPRIFVPQGSWASIRCVPEVNCVGSLLTLLHCLKVRGVFCVTLPEDFELKKCALLAGNLETEFRFYLAEFFVEAFSFSLCSQSDAFTDDSVAGERKRNAIDRETLLLPSETVARYLLFGMCGARPSTAISNTKSMLNTSFLIANASQELGVGSFSTFDWSQRRTEDLLQAPAQLSSTLLSIFPDAGMGRYIGKDLLHRFCALEGFRLKLQSLGKGTTGTSVKESWELLETERSLQFINPWKVPSNASYTSSSNPLEPNLVQTIPKEILDATAVHCAFTLDDNNFIHNMSPRGTKSDSLTCSSSPFLQLLSRCSFGLFENISADITRQSKLQQSLENENPHSELPRRRDTGPGTEGAALQSACYNSVRLGLCLRTLLHLYEAGAWSVSQDEDDARILLERTSLGEKERRDCHHRLTPQGGILFTVTLLFRELESQLLLIKISSLLEGSTQTVINNLEALDGTLSVIQLLAQELSPIVCSPDLLLSDPQQLCLKSLSSMVQWLSTTLAALLEKAADESLYPVYLSPHAQKEQQGGRKVRGTGGNMIGLAAAALVEGAATTYFPASQLLICIIDRCCRSLRKLHLEVISQIHSNSSSSFEKPLLDERNLIRSIHAALLKGGLLPNPSIINTNPASSIASPLKGVQKPPIVLLESVDPLSILLSSFGSKARTEEEVTSSTKEHVFALLHDQLYVLRTLYAESHLGSTIRIVEAMCRDTSILNQAEWGAEILKEMLFLRDASTRSIRFTATSLINHNPDNDSHGSILELTVPPLRSDFVLTETHRVAMCRAQAMAMLKCQGKRWGVVVGRSLFSACSGASSFIVRRQAAMFVSLPFKIYQRNLPVVFAELLDQVRDVVSSREGSRCATSLLAVTNSCAFAPGLEGDVVCFLLEVFATKSFEFKSMVLEALTYTYSHRQDKDEPERVGHNGDIAALYTIPASAQPTVPEYARIARANVLRVCFDWIWLHGHQLLSFPAKCFEYATVESFITQHMAQLLPIAILSMHKMRAPSISTSATSGYLQPQQLTSASTIIDSGDSSAIDAINDIMRARVDISSLLRQHFAAIVSLLMLLTKADDESGTKAPSGTSLKEYRLSAEKALGWLRLQIGPDLFPELCKRNTENIIVECLRHCRELSPTLPFCNFKVVVNAISYLCEITAVPNFTALLSAHTGDRAYTVLVSLYKHIVESPVSQREDTMRALQGFLSGLLGPVCLRIPIILDSTLHILCYIIKKYPNLRAMTCESLKYVWECVGESKDGHALLLPYFHLVSSFLNSFARESAEVAKCFQMVANTFKEHTDGAPMMTRTETIGGVPRTHHTMGHHAFVEPSQLVLAMSQMAEESDVIAPDRAAPAPKRKRVRGDDNHVAVPSSTDKTTENNATTASQALLAITTIYKILSRSGATGAPPASFFLSMAKVVDAQSLFLKRSIALEVYAKECAWVYTGVSDSFVRKERMEASRRARQLASLDLSKPTPLTITEEIQRAARHIWQICVRIDVPTDIRSAALETLRALVGCLLEGCGTEELLQTDFGPFNPLEISETTNGLTNNTSIKWRQVDFCAHSLEDNVSHLYCQLLAQIRSLAVDNDPHVMAVASTVLRDICADIVISDSILAASMSLMREAYPEEYTKIKPFRREQAARGPRAKSATSIESDALSSVAGLSDLVASFPLIPSEQLWSLAKTNFEAFLRVLTTQLLKSYVVQQYPSLSPFLALTAIHTSFAEKYLPLVLLHISMRKPTDDKERLRKFLATNFDAILRNKDISSHLTRVLLHAINFLRGARNSVIHQFGVIDTAYAQAAPANEEEKRRDKATKELRLELDRLNKNSLIGYRDKLSTLKDTLWFPTEHLPLTTLLAAAATCDEWALCIMFTEMCFDGLEGTNGLTASITYAVGSDAFFGHDAATNQQHTTRKAARTQKLVAAVKSMHEFVGPTLLQCASKLRDAGLLRQLLFSHRSLIVGASVAGATSNIRHLSAVLRRERYSLLGNWPVAMQADEKTWDGQHLPRLDNAVRAPTGTNSSINHKSSSQRLEGATTASFLIQLGCPRASYSVASAAEIAETAAEAAWRCGQWEEFPNFSSVIDANIASAAVHRSMLSALSHAHARDAAAVNTSVAEGREALIASLNAYNVIECCMLAQGLREVSLFSRLPTDLNGFVVVPPHWVTIADNKADILSGKHQELQSLTAAKKHCFQFAVGSPHYSLLEPLDAVRNALAGMGLKDEWRGAFLGQVARAAAEYNDPYTALRWVGDFVQQCRNPALLCDPAFAVGRSLLFNAAGDAEAAMQTLSDLPTLSKSPEALALLGAWAAKNQRLPLQKLVREPLMREMAMSDPANTFLFAMWCDSLMRGVKDNLESKAMQTSASHMQTIETSVPANAKDNKRFESLRKEVEEKDRQRSALQKDLALYADTAFIGLAKSLIAETTGNDLHSVYRILHHWLGEGAVDITLSAQEQIALIPPAKLLPVFPQLVVRVISTAQQRKLPPNQSESHDLLRKVVHGCIELFPTSCLWYVFALKQSTNAAKAEAATEMIEHVISIKELAPIVRQVATLVEAYTQQGTIPKDKESNIEGSTLQALVDAATQCSAVPVPTIPTRLVELNPLNKGRSLAAPAAHENGYKSISPTYKVLGGLSRPRLITITMQSGYTTRQIVKGGDDLRQDALIEQVFSLGNSLLAMRSGGTGVVAASGIKGDPLASLGKGKSFSPLSGWESHNQNRLYMRTYFAVPLGLDCGLIQFLDTATSVGDYLADDPNGAHRRYFPKEYTNYQCRAMLQRNARQSITASGKPLLAAYEEVCEGFTPAMHYFYFEHYASPKQWMEARKRYVTTAAVSSIIGYIVGLGDRHATNVMIDKHTAEIVHIDLGISFDQGTLLPIPEVVPFRLTRDMVDGMGVFGIEGPFRSICEQTLKSMRENKNLLNAVVETFVYDPLACWNIDITLKDTAPADTKKTKAQSQVEKSKFAPLKAHAALVRTNDKLTGLENGEVLAVPNQVQMLLQKATDPENLCLMFQGWSAWL